MTVCLPIKPSITNLVHDSFYNTQAPASILPPDFAGKRGWELGGAREAEMGEAVLGAVGANHTWGSVLDQS